MALTMALEEAHVAEFVRFAVVPSVYSPVAVNCCMPPAGIDALWGLISIAAGIALVTVREPDPDTAPEEAEMMVVPAPVLVATPLLPGVSLTVATAGTDELQCVELVRS